MHSDLEIDIPLKIGDIGFNDAENMVSAPPQEIPQNYPPYIMNQPAVNPTAPYPETMIPMSTPNIGFNLDNPSVSQPLLPSAPQPLLPPASQPLLPPALYPSIGPVPPPS